MRRGISGGRKLAQASEILKNDPWHSSFDIFNDAGDVLGKEHHNDFPVSD
jgi:hypothetical protein